MPLPQFKSLLLAGAFHAFKQLRQVPDLFVGSGLTSGDKFGAVLQS